MKRQYRHLRIIQEIIYVMNKKTKINFLLSKTYFLILGRVVFIIPQNSIASAFFG